ncbi:serine hydrolase domain-containing protein [Nonomuraea sp. NPDC049714]|uniref:serine hydrolase domain-containing protein n=1 Tax=Nonomuraea sp. NPDC049714 TaxID=3364357 RepID=UPI0037A03E9C
MGASHRTSTTWRHHHEAHPCRRRSQRSIAGLPASDATAAEVRVGGAKGSWQGVAGMTDLRTDRSAKQGARFRVGSVTKVFTVAVVLQLVAEGEISLDDTVQRHLPGLLPGSFPPVEIGQLLNHTSGLPSPKIGDSFEWVYATRFKKWTPREYVGEAVRNPMEFAPGTQQHYVNMNTFVAGLLIEKVTGRSYEHEVTTRILNPLGMRNSYLPGDSIRIRGRHNHGYQVVPKGFQNAIEYGRRYVVDMTVNSSSSTWASGDLISTTADLETFIKALFGGKVVRRRSLCTCSRCRRCPRTAPAIPPCTPRACPGWSCPVASWPTARPAPGTAAQPASAPPAT